MYIKLIKSNQQSSVIHFDRLMDPWNVCMYVREQGCEDTWLFLEAKGVRGQKSLGNTSLRQSGEE